MDSYTGKYENQQHYDINRPKANSCVEPGLCVIPPDVVCPIIVIIIPHILSVPSVILTNFDVASAITLAIVFVSDAMGWADIAVTSVVVADFGITAGITDAVVLQVSACRAAAAVTSIKIALWHVSSEITNAITLPTITGLWALQAPAMHHLFRSQLGKCGFIRTELCNQMVCNCCEVRNIVRYWEKLTTAASVHLPSSNYPMCSHVIPIPKR
jgi:hypothetical protein